MNVKAVAISPSYKIAIRVVRELCGCEGGRHLSKLQLSHVSRSEVQKLGFVLFWDFLSPPSVDIATRHFCLILFSRVRSVNLVGTWLHSSQKQETAS